MAAINIGSTAIDRANHMDLGGLTLFTKNGVANGTGTITSVEIYAYSAMSDVDVGIFYYVEAPHDYSTRSYVAIGDVAQGYNQFDVSLAVSSGDFIGIYGTSGAIDEAPGGNSILYRGGDNIPCTDAGFTFLLDGIMSLYGTGVTSAEDNAIFVGTNF